MTEVSINKHNKSIVIARGDIAYSQFGVADEILDLINEQQEEIERLEKENNLLKQLVGNGKQYTTGIR